MKKSLITSQKKCDGKLTFSIHKYSLWTHIPKIISLWPKLWLLGPRTPFSKIGSKMVRIQNFRNFLMDLFIITHTEPRYQILFVCDQNCDFWAQGPPFLKIGSRIARIQNFQDFLLDLFINIHFEPNTQNDSSANKMVTFGPKDPHFQKLGVKLSKFKFFEMFFWISL